MPSSASSLGPMLPADTLSTGFILSPLPGPSTYDTVCTQGESSSMALEHVKLRYTPALAPLHHPAGPRPSLAPSGDPLPHCQAHPSPRPSSTPLDLGREGEGMPWEPGGSPAPALARRRVGTGSINCLHTFLFPAGPR